MVRIIKESIDFEKDFNEFDFGNEDAEWYEGGEDIPKEYIKGATLLSKEEYEEYKYNIPHINDWWWLRSAGSYDYYACGVCHDGVVDYDYYVYGANYGIRPALILDLQSSNLNFGVGDKLEFGKHLFTIISNNLAICDDFIGKGCFRRDREAKDANDYEKSDVKKVVDNWFNESYGNYEE